MCPWFNWHSGIDFLTDFKWFNWHSGIDFLTDFKWFNWHSGIDFLTDFKWFNWHSGIDFLTDFKWFNWHSGIDFLTDFKWFNWHSGIDFLTDFKWFNWHSGIDFLTDFKREHCFTYSPKQNILPLSSATVQHFVCKLMFCYRDTVLSYHTHFPSCLFVTHQIQPAVAIFYGSAEIKYCNYYRMSTIIKYESKCPLVVFFISMVPVV